MQKMTSAYANKMLRSLEEDKNYWLKKESESSTYVAAVDEEPVIPDYDYATVAATIAEIDAKMAVIKHALNLANATAKVQVGDTEMSVDTILVKMAQLNRRKAVLDYMRKQLPKSRASQGKCLSVIRYLLYVYVHGYNKWGLSDKQLNHLTFPVRLENLRETACGGSVTGT